MKKIFAVLLAAIISTSAMTGCANKSSKDEVVGENEKIKFTFNVLGADKLDIENDERYKLLQDKFGLEFDLVACSFNDVNEKTRVWVSSGDIPDMMWADSGAVSRELHSWIDTGYLKDLPDLSKYPNLKKNQDIVKTDDYFMKDGKRYFYFTMRDNNDVDFKGATVFMYRKDWAKKLGMYKEEYTWDEMIELAKAMVEKDPGGNGVGKTIGLTTVGWALPDFIGLLQSSPNYSGAVKKDGKYVWAAGEPETIEGLKVVKNLIDEGVLWSDQILAKSNDGPARFNAGQAGIIMDNFMYPRITGTVDAFRELYPDSDPTEHMAVMKVKSPDGTFFQSEVEDTWGCLSFNANIGEQKFDRALKMLDYLASDEGKMLQQYGIEGKDYKLNGDKIEMLWDKDDKGLYISPYKPGSDGILSFTQLLEFQKGKTEYADPSAKAIWQEVEDYLNSVNNLSKVDYDLRYFSGPVADKFNVDVKSKTKEFLASSKNIEKDWKEWVKQQEDKVTPYLKELNDNLK